MPAALWCCTCNTTQASCTFHGSMKYTANIVIHHPKFYQYANNLVHQTFMAWFEDCIHFHIWRKPKSKLQIPTPDIWWCPWDKGGAVMYVIGGTHPPIWLAIDINHHQISNGHAFPSVLKCAINLFQNILLSSVCVSERSSWFWEADERQFVRTRAPREAERRRWWLPLVNGPGNLKWALSSWKQRSCHTTWEWCENQRRKKPTKVLLGWQWLYFGIVASRLWAYLNNLWI